MVSDNFSMHFKTLSAVRFENIFGAFQKFCSSIRDNRDATSYHFLACLDLANKRVSVRICVLWRSVYPATHGGEIIEWHFGTRAFDAIRIAGFGSTRFARP